MITFSCTIRTLKTNFWFFLYPFAFLAVSFCIWCRLYCCFFFLFSSFSIHIDRKRWFLVYFFTFTFVARFVRFFLWVCSVSVCCNEFCAYLVFCFISSINISIIVNSTNMMASVLRPPYCKKRSNVGLCLLFYLLCRVKYVIKNCLAFIQYTRCFV